MSAALVVRNGILLGATLIPVLPATVRPLHWLDAIGHIRRAGLSV